MAREMMVYEEGDEFVVIRFDGSACVYRIESGVPRVQD